MVVVSNILSKSSGLKPDEVMNLAEAELALNHKLFVLLAKWVSRGGEQRSCPSTQQLYVLRNEQSPKGLPWVC